MRILKSALLAGVFALAGAIPAAQADTLQILQCSSCSGDTAASAAGSPSFSTAVNSAGTWTPTTPGVYSFSATDTTIGGFLGSGLGTASITFNSGFSLASTATTAGSGIQTEWIFGFTVGGPLANVTITHDDGIALLVNGILQNPTSCSSGGGGPCTAAGQELPTTAETTTYLGLLPGSYTLEYVSSNGLPEVLRMSIQTVPLPAALWLFGSGLGGLALLSRRRRKSGSALVAAQ